jgi:hypothetical protein
MELVGCYRMGIFEERERKIKFIPKKVQYQNGRNQNLHIDNFCNLYSSPNI